MTECFDDWLLTYCIHSSPWRPTQPPLPRSAIFTRRARISFLTHIARVSLDPLGSFRAGRWGHTYLDICFLYEARLTWGAWSTSVTLDEKKHLVNKRKPKLNISLTRGNSGNLNISLTRGNLN
jgi:hypothetical protein